MKRKHWTPDDLPTKRSQARKLWDWASGFSEVYNLSYNLLSPNSHIMTPKYRIETSVGVLMLDDMRVVELSGDEVLEFIKSKYHRLGWYYLE